MDVGTGNIIAAIVLVTGPMFASWLSRRAARKDAVALDLKVNAIKEQSQLTHDLVNSGLSKLIAAKDALRESDVAGARAEGKLEGKAEAKEQAIVEQAAAIVAGGGNKT